LKKRYGQHFISDRNILQRIVRLAAIVLVATAVAALSPLRRASCTPRAAWLLHGH
jgi:hypothetical protein